MKKARIIDTYSEAFEGILCQVVMTADNDETLLNAARDATATPSIVIGRVEGGIEEWLEKKDTPDKRKGAVLQFWGGIDPKKPFSESLKKFEIELSYRIRQDILVKPFTAVFDASTRFEGRIDMMERVGHCGDGYERMENLYGRAVVIVPLMVPDFIIERYIGYNRGVMGANFWVMCKSKEAVHRVAKNALQAIGKVKGVIAPFGVCSAGSKPETSYPWIGPTTNHPYCPSLKRELSNKSEVPENVNYIPEIVINGVSMEAVKNAMKAGIREALNVDGVMKISAGNYGGKLGNYKIYLHELFS